MTPGLTFSQHALFMFTQSKGEGIENYFQKAH